MSQNTLLTEIKIFADEYAAEQLDPYISYVQRPEVAFNAKEINDALWGTLRLSPIESAILDSPLLQRLRYIKQLGVVHWVYPGAVHTRFDHTLGVISRIQELLSAIERSIKSDAPGHEINPSLVALLRLSAMLHDIGHGVFSHVSENGLERFDNLRTALIDFSNNNRPSKPKLSELFASYLIESPSFEKLINILQSRLGNPITIPDLGPQASHIVKVLRDSILGLPINDQIPLLHELVSGPFDADKLDYFVRDSKLAGIPSVLDISRLVQKLVVKSVPSKSLPPTIGQSVKGGHASYLLFGLKWSGATMLDELHLARILLFAKIYRHQKVLAIEAMVEALFEALGEIVPIVSLIKLSQLFTDDHLLSATADEIVKVLKLKSSSIASPQIRFSIDVLRRLRLRKLFVKGFVVQNPFPGDPWADNAEQQTGLRELVDDLERPPNARDLKKVIADEIDRISTLVPQQAAQGFAREFIFPSLVISTKPRLTGGTQIDRALVFQDDRIVSYKDLTVNRHAWADAYSFSSASGYIFCPREVSSACYIATEKILRTKYGIITPRSAMQLSKQSRPAIEELKRQLDSAGYYSGVPHDIRPLPRRLGRADVDNFLDEMSTKFSGVEEPSIDPEIRRSSELASRLKDWLSQFRDDRHIAQAMEALKRIRVLRREDTRAAIQNFLREKPQFRGATVCLLGSLKDSSALQSYYSIDVGQLLSEPNTVEKAAADRVDKPVVFIDDIIASGGQIKTVLGNWFNIAGLKANDLNEQRTLFGEDEKAYLRDRPVGFIFLAGWNSGLKSLSECCRDIGIDSTVYAHIGESEIPFAFDGYNIPHGSAEDVASFRAKCFDIGKQILLSNGVDEATVSERSLGYGNRAMLLVSNYNVPTQTMTCMWGQGTYDGVNWTPFLRRRKKH